VRCGDAARAVERGAAAAGRLRLRILDLETAAVQPVDEVDGGCLQVLRADGIDEHLEGAAVDDEVRGAAPLRERQAVREAGAAAADHLNAQALADLVLRRHDLRYLLLRLLGHLQHGNDLLWMEWDMFDAFDVRFIRFNSRA